MHTEALNDKGREIFKNLKGFNDFYLAGGTALALQIGHRASVDFDLFSKNEISPALLPEVEQMFGRSNTRAAVNNKEELSVFVGDIKITFLQYPFPTLLPLIVIESVPLLAPKEIAATKAYTVGRRGSYKDYIDLFFLVRDGHTTLDEIISLAEKKYGNVFNARLFLEQLVYMDDITDIEIVFLREKVEKKDVAAFFKKAVSAFKI